MTAPHIVDPAGLLGQALADASPDLMRELLQTMINALLSADADAVCGAQWNARSAERTNYRNGYRHRPLDTRVGTVDVAVPKLRSGSYFPEWLLERRKRAESALITVVADCYLAGVSTRRMDKLVKTLGIDSLSKSQVSRMATELDEQVTAFRHRRLDEAGSSAWMESALLDPNGGQRWVIYDEAWRLMSEPALLKRMDAHWRLARAYGISNMLIFHKLTDLENVGDQGSAMRSLANSLLANAESRIIYRQESDQLGSTAKTLGLTGNERELLPTLGTGQGLWRIKDRSFVVQHQLHPDEYELFDTTARMGRIPRKFKISEGASA